MARLSIRLMVVTTVAAILGLASTAVAEDAVKETVKGRIRRLVPSKNQIIVVDKAGTDHIIDVDKATAIKLNQKKEKRKFSSDDVLKKDQDYFAFRRESKMSYLPDRHVHGLRTGDEVVVELHRTEDKRVAALILAD